MRACTLTRLLNLGFSCWQDQQLYMGELSGSAFIAFDEGRFAITISGASGTWTSPPVRYVRGIHTLNPSWQAYTPKGTHIAVELQVRYQKCWSRWYRMGEWAFENTEHFSRTSFGKQRDDFGLVETDTYVNDTDMKIVAYRLRVHLVANGAKVPRIFQLACQAAQKMPFTQVSTTRVQKRVELSVPPLAQYAHRGEYPELGSGEAWCSPATTAMMLLFCKAGPTTSDLAAMPYDEVFKAHGRADGEVPFAALHSHDAAYGGSGNWSFATAYMAHFGLPANVRVLSSLRSVENEILNQRPVGISLSWDNDHEDPAMHLEGADLASSDGHLLVICGFQEDGDVIVNDPATKAGNSGVRKVYRRDQLERRWFEGSNRTAYALLH